LAKQEIPGEFFTLVLSIIETLSCPRFEKYIFTLMWKLCLSYCNYNRPKQRCESYEALHTIGKKIETALVAEFPLKFNRLSLLSQ
jgi:hypothetical protein